MNKYLYFCALLSGCLCQPSTAQVADQTMDASRFLPAEYRVEWTPGVDGGIPDVPVIQELKPGDLPAAPEDASIAIQRELDRLEGPGALALPEGTFNIHRRLYLREGLVLRGQGAASTHLRIRVEDPDGYWYSSIVLKGNGAETDRPLAGGVEAGSEVIEVLDASGIVPGQLAWLFMFNDPEVLAAGRDEWNPDWSERAVGQMFHIERVKGNRLYLDGAIRLDFPEYRKPGVRIYTPVRRAGLEGIHFLMMGGAGGGIVTMETAENCWIRDCEFEKSRGSHISLRRSKNISIVNNYVHHGQLYSGGRAYGISTDWSTSDCLVEANVLSVLRHAISLSLGANGCVWGYNFLRAQTDDSMKDRLRDISLHGNYPYMNLFEGNVAEFAATSDWWGSSGPLNTFFRNRIDPSPDDPSGWNPPFQIQYRTHRQVVVGNTLARNQGIYIEPGCEDNLVAANWMNGKIDYSGLNTEHLPESLYLQGKPDWWGNTPWPAIGADVDSGKVKDGTVIRIPAQDWFDAIRRAGFTMPFSERFQY